MYFIFYKLLLYLYFNIYFLFFIRQYTEQLDVLKLKKKRINKIILCRRPERGDLYFHKIE